MFQTVLSILLRKTYAVPRSVVLAALLFVAACGFEPLYPQAAKNTHMQPLSSAFKTVRVARIDDRRGQKLRRLMEDLLGTRRDIINARWQLTIILERNIRGIGVEKTAFPTHRNVTVLAHVTLSPLIGEAVAEAGATQQSDAPQSYVETIPITTSYNVLMSEYNNIIAERDAEDRALHNLAQQIMLRVGTWMKS